MNTKVTVEKHHPACWELVEGRWRMTQQYNEIWWQYQKSQISRASFFRRKAALKAAYDAEGPPF